jgi:hypothetical protein
MIIFGRDRWATPIMANSHAIDWYSCLMHEWRDLYYFHNLTNLYYNLTLTRWEVQHLWVKVGHSEREPTSAPWRMNSKWSGISFLLGSSSLANHGGYLSCCFFVPTTNNSQPGC